MKDFLINLHKVGKERKIPNISLENANFLRKILFITKTKKILEIGTANGFSAINFAVELNKNFVHTENVGITTIEFSQKAYFEALENFKNSGLEKFINPIFGDARIEIPKLEEEFDMIFIDGMKKLTKEFFELSWPKLKTGGFFIIDDVIKFKEKMQDFYDFLEENKIDFSIIPIDFDDGIMLIEKREETFSNYSKIS